MGQIQFTKDDQLSPELRDILSELDSYAESAMDDIGTIEQDAMQFIVPIGATGELGHNIIVEVDGKLSRSIYSLSDHWDAVVGGHNVFGPIFSDKQRRWWFWYLWNILGGEYVNKTDGYLPGNDFPLIAMEMADSNVEARVNEFLDQVVS